MEAAYSGLKSYRHAMSAVGREVIGISARSGEITSELRYQAPNRVYLYLSSPAVGDVTVSTNGREQTLVFSKRKMALRLPAPATMKDFIEGLKRYQIVAVLDPLYFLSGQPASNLAEGFMADGQENIDRVLCNRVVGRLKRNATQSARSGKVTFWMDPKTSLLRKTLLELEGVRVRTTTRPNPKLPPVVTINLAEKSVSEVIRNAQIDPPLKDADLTATIPPGIKLRAPPKSR
jgi:hypothetical protein